ncbi:MAG TPA: hypothetical protein VNO81_09645 [Candidatus Nitrosotenuis sp.]|jgi:hypothetical protein|nr:hypothetical protein [Candidatus Nitrosotenuis sp.]
MSAELRSLSGPPDEALVAELVARGPGVADALLEMVRARDAGEWPLLGAVRVLGRLREARAAGPLVDLLATCAVPFEDALGEEVLAALEQIGPPALGPLLDLARRPGSGEHGELALDLAVKVAAWAEEAPERADLGQLLRQRFRTAAYPGERSLYAGYLGDLADAESLGLLLEALDNPELTLPEYQALQEAIEKLDAECPEFYFDEQGRPYRLDEDGHPLCATCRQPMAIDPESGELLHPDGTPAGH